MGKRRPRNPKLAARMAELGYRGTDVAALAGISPVTFSRILNGRNDPTSETAEKIARALGRSIDELGLEIYQAPRVEDLT